MRRADVQFPVRSEHYARSISAIERLPRIGDEDVLHIIESLAIESSSCQRRGRPIPVSAIRVLPLFDVCQVYKAVAGEIRMQRDVEQLVDREPAEPADR